jgi:hypothetical protein
MLEQMLLTEDMSGVRHEIVEEGELLGCQLEDFATSARLEPRRVQPKRSYFEDRVVALVSPQEGPHPGRQLGEGEWLDQVVIGT